MDSNRKRIRRHGPSQSSFCRDGASSGGASPAGAVTFNKTSSDIVMAAAEEQQVQQKEKPLFSFGVPVSDAATKRTPPTLLAGFLEACRWCKETIENEMYMYGIFSAFCSPECRAKQMRAENYFIGEEKSGDDKN